MKNEPVFVDWITASQHHPEGGLPLIQQGLHAWFDAGGNCRLERVSPASVSGSYDTSVRLSCDGHRVFLSGNVGRFGRQDNVWNFGWDDTARLCNRILARAGLPPFGAARVLPGGSVQAGARIHRLDVTANFSAGSDPQARAVIRWLAAQSVSRAKRGSAGDESVWWSNTRRMFKAYLKAWEMLAHGAERGWPVVEWCLTSGVVRVEVELKRRMLPELGLDEWGSVSQAKLARVFRDETDILRRVDRSEEPDILAQLPTRVRMVAAAWMAGQDIRALVSRATLFRYAKACREHGLDIMAPRNVTAFPVRVRVIDLQPLEVPVWYRLRSGLEEEAA